MDIATLLQRYPLISEQVSADEIRLILTQLTHVVTQSVPGAVVEFGCYRGTTSLFIQRLLQAIDPARPFHVYDSFAGLPNKTAADMSPAGEQFQPGELTATKAQLIHHFKQASLPLPFIHKGWFDTLQPADIPAPIAFAFLDGDYYQSIKDSLRLIEAKMSPGAVIMVDDYQSEALPGAVKAVNEWLAHHAQYKLQVQASLAIITTEYLVITV